MAEHQEPNGTEDWEKIELPLDESTQEVEPIWSLEDEKGSRRRWWWLLLLPVVGLAIWAYLQWRPTPSEETATPAQASTSRQEEARSEVPEPAIELPELDQSDAWLREVAAQLSAHPRLAQWLVQEDLVRRFVVTVDNLAEGTNPRKHVAFLDSGEPFEVVEEGGRFTVADTSYARYEPLAQVVDSLHVEGTADLYRRIEPLIAQAYRDLGYPDREFDRVLEQALRRVLAVPVVEGGVEVVPKLKSYAYADPTLEGLPGVEKQFLRLGAKNLSTIQAKIRAIGQQAGLDLGS